jgi:hypothetical protein
MRPWRKLRHEYSFDISSSANQRCVAQPRTLSLWRDASSPADTPRDLVVRQL